MLDADPQTQALEILTSQLSRVEEKLDRVIERTTTKDETGKIEERLHSLTLRVYLLFGGLVGIQGLIEYFKG